MNDSPSHRELLHRLGTDPDSALPGDPAVIGAGHAMAAELLRLSSHIDEQIDPVVNVVGSLVAGFHGFKPPEDVDTAGLFEVGARQRARLDDLEDRVGRLGQMVEDLKTATAARPVERRRPPVLPPGPSRPTPPVTVRVTGTESDLQRAFWWSYLVVGFFTQLLAVLVIEGYLETAHYRLHRPILLGLAGVALVAALGGLVSARWIAGSRWRSHMSTMWCLASIASIGVSAYLDAGINSPLLYLLALPVLYATVALQMPQVRSCVLAAMFQPVWIGLINPKVTSSYGSLTVLIGMVVGVSALAMTLAGYRSRLQDQQRLLVQELEARAVTDSLTGCGTTQAFHQHLREEFDRASRDRRQLSLLACDIDFLKDYNDTYGHLAGDQILLHISSAITACLRPCDYVGRTGGDEFGVILPDTTEDEAYLAAGKIMARVVKDGNAAATLSIGVAALQPRLASPVDLFQQADLALRQAKSVGRGTVRMARDC